MEINILKSLFLWMAFSIGFVGFLMNTVEKYLPTIIVQTFRYGKFAYDGKPSAIKTIDVPKRWFQHFYVFASVYSLFVLYLAIDSYIYLEKPRTYFISFLDLFLGSSRIATGSTMSVFLALCLITLQSYRRFYETWFISVFCDSKINLSHYVIGYFHYFGTVSMIISQAPGFTSLGDQRLSLSSISTKDIICTGLFLYGWFHQYRSAKILAGLRKNSSGAVVTFKHSIPMGGLFQYVSSPHMFCEILMYLSLLILLLPATNMVYVFLWVFLNQIESALLTHWWYLEKFNDYPKNRKAIIPGVL